MEDNNNEHKNKVTQITASLLGVAILIVSVVGISFAAFSYTGTGTKENSLATGTISMTYTESTNGIAITDAMPLADATGKALSASTTGNVFDFTVGATISGTTTINYEVAAIKDDTSTMTNSEVKLYLEKESSGSYTQVLAPANFTPIASATTIGSPSGSMVIATGSFSASGTEQYRLRMWMASDATVTGTSKMFKIKVNVYGKVS